MKNIRKFFSYGFITLLVGLFVLIAMGLLLSVLGSYKDHSVEKAFNQKLEEKISVGETQIYLRDLVDLKWDKACYLSFTDNYSVDGDFSIDSEEISKIIGRTYSGRNPQHRCDTNKYNAMIFVSNEHTSLVNIDRCSLRFSEETKPINRNICFSNSAYFQVDEHPKNPEWKYLSFKED